MHGVYFSYSLLILINLLTLHTAGGILYSFFGTNKNHPNKLHDHEYYAP
jgi:hypothetical protein